MLTFLVYLAALLLLLFLLLSVAVAIYTVYDIHHPLRRRFSDNRFLTPFELQIPYRDVRFSASDGVVLSGWFLPRKKSRRLILLLCGRDGRKHDLIGIGSGLWRAGFSVFLFDYRGRGQSEQSRVSVGYYERRDAEAALKKARQLSRQVAPPNSRLLIALLGYSMGGNLALRMAAEKRDLQAVVADCPFSSLRSIIRERYRRFGFYPDWIALGLASFAIKRLFGYSIEAVEALSAVKQIAPRPLLLIHGLGDRAVAAEHSRRLYGAAGEPRHLQLEEVVEHCGVYFSDRQRYTANVANFFRKAMNDGQR